MSYQTINSTRVSVYKGLHFVPKPNVERPASTQTPAIPDGWIKLQHPTDDFYGLRTDYKSNGLAIWKEVRVDTHGNVSVTVGGREVDPGHIGMPCHISNIMPLGDCLNIVATSRICVGKEVDETHRNGVLHAVGDSQTIRIQSPSCHVLMSVLSRGSICRRCYKQVISMRDEAVDGEPVKTEEQEDSEVHHIDENETEELLHKLFPNVNKKLFDFLRTQSEFSHGEVQGKDPRTRRWPNTVVSTCLSLWISSPVSYRLLQSFMFLPTERLLQLYKNNIDKEPGVNMDMIRWMSQEIERTGTPKEGGIIFDEMNIQPGVQLEPHHNGLRMFGYVDYGKYNNGISEATKSDCGFQLAASALQFVFLAYNGFRFPLCYMLTKCLTAGQLISLFWDLVNQLKSAGFYVSYTCMDGAAINRSFVNLICGHTVPVARSIVYLNRNLMCIMDFSHVVKKIRNSIYASGLAPHHKRNLKTPHGLIYWKHFVDAYYWDYNSNYLRLHRKLCKDHFLLNSNLKMRNHLAEQVLDSNMLYLMERYQQTLSDPSQLNACVSLLRVTSSFISIFRSAEPITSTTDDRLTELGKILAFFTDWEAHYKEEKHVNDKPTFITNESFVDLKYCIQGFVALCHERIPPATIVPRLVNSDVCENVFCQHRANYNGANTNPDASHYRYNGT